MRDCIQTDVAQVTLHQASVSLFDETVIVLLVRVTAEELPVRILHLEVAHMVIEELGAVIGMNMRDLERHTLQ